MADQIYGVRCGFFDAVDSDRTYSADDMNKPYNRLVSDGVFAANEGTPSSDFQVLAAGNSMNISVSRGAGIVAHKWFENISTLTITVPVNSAVYTRIDSVILQVDKRTTGRVGNVVYRTGTATQPDINTSSDVVELRVANIAVTPSASTISQENITDLRGSAECPWVAGLIQQLDTSTLWAQYQAAYARQYDQYTQDYDEYVEQQRQAWEDFIHTLTDELTVSTNVVSFTSVYTTLGEVSTIPISISSYLPETDVLQVYINGLLATYNIDYTVAVDGTTISLTQSLDAGQTVVFVVLKSIIGGNIESAVSLIQRVDDKIDGFMEDTGWFPLVLDAGVSAQEGNAPMARMIGSRVQIRGAITGVSAYNTLVATLPMTFKPAADVVYASAAVDDSGNASAVTVTVSAASGDITVSSGSMSGTDIISLTISYLANYSSNMPMIYNYCGSVPEYADLPTDAHAGDVYIVNTADLDHDIAAGDSVLWNGAEWEIISDTITDVDIDSIINTI